METTENRWETAITLLFRPQLLLQGTVEYLLAWSYTRGWLRLLLLYSPFILIVTAVAALVGYGLTLDRNTLAERYGEWVTEELPHALQYADEVSEPAAGRGGAENGSETPSAESADMATAQESAGMPTDDEKITPYGDLLLRRLLQLRDSNSRITYLVARQLAQQNRLGQARQMMRRIAPTGGGGFMPAHAWLAIDQLQGRTIQSVEDRQRLQHDLEMAARWGNVHPALLAVYADLLESQGKSDRALSVLEQSSGLDSELANKVKLANLAAKYGQTARFERVAQELKAEVQKRIDQDTATVDDFTHLAHLLLLERKPQEARKATAMGLIMQPESAQLKRLMSEAYRVEYILTSKVTETNTSVDLSLLDSALKTDPTNPAVGMEIAWLIAAGHEAPPEMKTALEEHLGSGQATALTHILIANRSLSDGDLAAAIPHLELALRQAPNSPIVLNNLALALARTDPGSIERALEFATVAVNADPGNAEYLDTLGEIRALAGDKLGAVEAYETAIGRDGTRDGTRQQLAQLYRELGMAEMAAIQEKELEKQTGDR